MFFFFCTYILHLLCGLYKRKCFGLNYFYLYELLEFTQRELKKKRSGHIVAGFRKEERVVY